MIYANAVEDRRTYREDAYPEPCGCGCSGPSTHVGLAGGVAMTAGCEWAVRKWCQHPANDPRDISQESRA